jgi:hypothetical protein
LFFTSIKIIDRLHTMNVKSQRNAWQFIIFHKEGLIQINRHARSCRYTGRFICKTPFSACWNHNLCDVKLNPVHFDSMKFGQLLRLQEIFVIPETARIVYMVTNYVSHTVIRVCCRHRTHTARHTNCLTVCVSDFNNWSSSGWYHAITF